MVASVVLNHLTGPRNEKNSGGGLGGVPNLKYCEPSWLADEENF